MSYFKKIIFKLRKLLLPKTIIAVIRKKNLYNEILYEESINGTTEDNKYCLFAGFDKNSIIHDYVLYYLKAIHEAGFKIIFVSSSGEIKEKDINKLRKYCQVVIKRNNSGYDFYSWKTAWDYLKNKNINIDRLLITNDSIYGPVFPLNDMFSKMNEKADIWGASDSYEIKYHLQSFFWIINSTVITSSFFNNFWNSMLPFQDKTLIVKKYEVGFTQQAIKAGFKTDAYAKYSTKSVNATLLAWKELIEKYRFPFIKTYLLRYNPYNEIELEENIKLLCKKYNYNFELIAHHML